MPQISILMPSLEYINTHLCIWDKFGILVMRYTWYPCNEQSEGNGALLRGNPNHPTQPGSKLFQVQTIWKNTAQIFLFTLVHCHNHMFSFTGRMFLSPQSWLLLPSPSPKEESNVWLQNDISLRQTYTRDRLMTCVHLKFPPAYLADDFPSFQLSIV